MGSFDAPGAAPKMDKGEELFQRMQRGERTSMVDVVKQPKVAAPAGETEIEKRARKASQAAIKLLEAERAAEQEEEERKKEPIREQKRQEAEALNLKVQQQRAHAEEGIRLLRERMAKAREEAKRAEEEQAKAAAQASGSVPSDYIKEHIARAKQRAKELQQMMDEEQQRTHELETIKLRRVEMPGQKERQEDEQAAAFQLEAQRRTQGALKSIRDRDAQKKAEHQQRMQGLERAREAELQRRKVVEQQFKEEEKTLVEQGEKLERMQAEYQQALITESKISAQKKKSKADAEALAKATVQKQELEGLIKLLEEQLPPRRLELLRKQKEEKKRQEEDDIRYIRESSQFQNDRPGSVWSSVLNKKRVSTIGEGTGEGATGEGMGEGATGEGKMLAEEEPNLELTSAEKEDMLLRAQIAAMSSPSKRKNVRFIMDPAWGEGSIARPGRSLVRLRKFKHLISAPQEADESRMCVMAIFTDVCALCKPEANGCLRLLFRLTARALAWAELAPFDPAVIIMHFASNVPPVYLRCSSPIESHYWIYLFPRSEEPAIFS